MGARYSSQAASSYNASPPADDGSATASNKITWAGIKTKLADSVKGLADAINTALLTFSDFSSRTTSVSDTCSTADHMMTIEFTNSITLTLPDATATGKGFVVSYKNVGTGVGTFALTTATDTIDGVVNGASTLGPNQSITWKTNAGATGYYCQSVGGTKGTFTATLTGVNAAVTGTAAYSVANNVVTVFYPILTGTSNATSCTLTGQPAAIQPTTAHGGFAVMIEDNTATPTGFGRADVGTNGVVTLSLNAAGGGGFTNSGTKGIPVGLTLTYNLN